MAPSTPDEPDPRPPPASNEDLALVARLRARDRAAFTEILELHHGSLLRTARLYVRSEALAEDVVQETWLAVFTGIARFEGRSSLKTWIFRILTNRAKTRGTREARSVPLSDGNDDDAPAVDPGRFRPNETWSAPPARWEDGTPERLLGDKEAIAEMMRIVERLPERQRLVLTLRDIEGFDPEEVRNILEVSETNQRVLLHRARSKVRSELERYLSEAPAQRPPRE